MSVWRALPGMAVGTMVELYSHRSPYCALIGHRPKWHAGALSCGRKGCRQAFPAATAALLAEFDTLEGHVMVADELRRHVEGFTTDDDQTGAW